MSSAVDLSLLPAPNVVELLDYETILTERKAALLARTPVERRAEVEATLAIESEPLTMLLQESAYRELLWRQRVNDAARAVMLAYAKDKDLDHLAARQGVTRLVITPADPATGTPAVMERDDDLRERVQLAPEALSVAGTPGAYTFHAKSADGHIQDVKISSPSAGVVLVTLLTREGSGTASQDIINRVTTALGDDVRPLTDQVVVQSATPVATNVTATLTIDPSADEAAIRSTVVANLDRMLVEKRKIGQKLAKSALYAALHPPGVVSVDLPLPAADVAVNDSQAVWCSGYSINIVRAA